LTDSILALHELAEAAGILTAYRDSRSRLRVATPEALLAVLRALEIDIDRPSQAPSALAGLRSRPPAPSPVTVAWGGRLDIRVPAGSARAFALEGGREREIPVATRLTAAGPRLQATEALPTGRHTLRLESGEASWPVLAISAPTTAPRLENARAWGMFMPVHAFGAGHDRQGTYAEMEDWARRIAALGGSFLGTLPLLASFLDAPFEPSPYAPASRLFWSELHLAAPAVERDAAGSRSRLLDHAELASRLKPELQAAADRFFETGADTAAEFGAFLEANPRARDYARFRAACDRFRCGFPQWPAAARGGHLEAGDIDPADERRHLYAAFRADERLAALAREARAGRAAALYLDLPLGVHQHGYDAWRERTLFAQGIRAGAPPDALFRGGQNWGFHPLVPQALRRDGYAYLSAVLRHHMRHAGALRLDHVMSLVRLYWIPDGFPATEGVYVRYPRDELLALLLLEASLHRTLLIGEDLGTVPEEVRATMRTRELLHMFVLQFAFTGGRTLPRAPRGVVASLGTHDTPTFAGFWRGLDIADQADLGLIDDARARAAHAERARLRTRIAEALALDPESLAEADVLRGLLLELAASRADLVIVALEDLWLEPDPQNVPGTAHERPNWRRRARHAGSDALRDPAVVNLLTAIARVRAGVSPEADS
jgi:4-alpha-glucanotransferase